MGISTIRNHVKSITSWLGSSIVAVFLLTASAYAIPFNISVTGSSSLSNANLELTGSNTDLTDGQTDIVQIGTLSATNAVNGVMSDSIVFNLSFGANSNGNSGVPISASSASVSGTLFQIPISDTNVLALAALDPNPSTMIFDFDFGTLTLNVSTENVFSVDNSTPFNISATFIADDNPINISEPGTLAIISLTLLGITWFRKTTT